MPETEKDIEAKRLIHGLMNKLVHLNNGKPLPSDWVIILKSAATKASKATSNKRGPKIDQERVALVTQLIINNWEHIFKERTKHHKPGKFKDAIALSSGFSRKQVDRYIEQYEKAIKNSSSIDPDLEYAFMWGAALSGFETSNDE